MYYLYALYKIKLSTVLFFIFVISLVLGSFIYAAYLDTLKYQYSVTLTKAQKAELSWDILHQSLHNRLKFYMNFLSAGKVPEQSALKTFKIYTTPKKLALLNEDLPKSGDNYVSGYLLSPENAIKKIELHYRGKLPIHWLYKQKSLRIKLDKDELHNFNRRFNLINPPHDFFPIDFVNYDLSRELGLLTPDSEPVRVFINNDYMGVYSYLSQIDEYFLRKNHRMPGSIYYGELDDKYGKQAVDALWREPKLWNKRASRNKESEASREDINTFISAINKLNDSEFYEFFQQYANKEKFYTFWAIDSLVGSHHHDFTHNHKLYFDPYLGKFEPVQWDVRFWTQFPVKSFVYYPLLRRIALNPILEFERDRKAYEILQQYPPENIVKRLENYRNLLWDDLKADKNRDNAVADYKYGAYFSYPFAMHEFAASMENMKNIISNRSRWLNSRYNSSKVSYTMIELDHDKILITFEVDENSPVELDLTEHFEPLNNSRAIKIYRDINRNERIDEGELSIKSQFRLYPGRKVASLPWTLDKNTQKAQFGNDVNFAPSPLYYSFIVENAKYSNQPMLASNLVTKLPVKVKLAEQEFSQNPATLSVHPWKLSNKNNIKIINLEGTIIVNKDIEYDKNTRVMINPGTTFIMSPGKSIYFFGTVQAKGNKEQPIKFIPKFDDKPWGSIVVQGRSASDSQFSFIEMNGGSITSKNLIHYPGQFNIHDVENFKLSDCRIGNNSIGDDSLHVAYSSGSIQSCIFYKSNSDALDIDISQVTIDKTVFVSSANDSVDLMTSDVTLLNSLFLSADDKCVSIGEWSRAQLSHNILYDCNIAVEVKDKSVSEVKNSILAKSRTLAINLYNKNYHYDSGGELSGENLFFYGNSKIKKDKRSHINKLINKNYQIPKIETFYPLQNESHIVNWQDLSNHLNDLKNRYD